MRESTVIYYNVIRMLILINCTVKKRVVSFSDYFVFFNELSYITRSKHGFYYLIWSWQTGIIIKMSSI